MKFVRFQKVSYICLIRSTQSDYCADQIALCYTQRNEPICKFSIIVFKLMYLIPKHFCADGFGNVSKTSVTI